MFRFSQKNNFKQTYRTFDQRAVIESNRNVSFQLITL